MNIMNPPDANDPLDALLREQNNYIEDNGFTTRVVSALPRTPRHEWVRTVILLGATGVGYVLAIFWLPWENIANVFVSFSLDSQTLMGCAVFLAIAGSLVWGLVTALSSEEF